MESCSKKHVSMGSLRGTVNVSGSSSNFQRTRIFGEADLRAQEKHMLTYFLINLRDLVGSFVLERHLGRVVWLLCGISKGRNR